MANSLSPFALQLNLFADLEATQQVSSGSIPAATLSGCQQDENGGSQNSTFSAPTQTMTVTNIQSASATSATDDSLKTAQSPSNGSLLDSTDSSNKKLIHSGISIGVLGFVLLIVTTLFVIRCRRKRKQSSKEYHTSQNWSEDA
jgi:carbohydrate-binding DOMON domain-containing protein